MRLLGIIWRLFEDENEVRTGFKIKPWGILILTDKNKWKKSKVNEYDFFFWLDLVSQRKHSVEQFFFKLSVSSLEIRNCVVVLKELNPWGAASFLVSCAWKLTWVSSDIFVWGT